MTRLIQIANGSTRRVALVEEPNVRLLDRFHSVHALATAALAAGEKLPAWVPRHETGENLDYEPIYNGRSAWRLLPPIDHPGEPARCLVSGTGLTHLGSAADRNAMHEVKETELTDSMKMFRWGVANGRPAAGHIGIAPEWFYKGTGAVLRAHGEPLERPAYAEDGGEEGEIAGLYLIDNAGQPCRVGFAIGNEFSDHQFEKKNYLNLAGSKLRTCSIGPELVIDAEFHSVPGVVTVHRAGDVLWSKPILTGEEEMCHSLRNIEHHHFKFESHRRPGDVHVHYFGACSLSFGAGIRLTDGDVMEIRFDGFGRPLRNPLRLAGVDDRLITVESLA